MKSVKRSKKLERETSRVDHLNEEHETQIASRVDVFLKLH